MYFQKRTHCKEVFICTQPSHMWTVTQHYCDLFISTNKHMICTQQTYDLYSANKHVICTKKRWSVLNTHICDLYSANKHVICTRLTNMWSVLNKHVICTQLSQTVIELITLKMQRRSCNKTTFKADKSKSLYRDCLNIET